jgi:hypothetical protein
MISLSSVGVSRMKLTPTCRRSLRRDQKIVGNEVIDVLHVDAEIGAAIAVDVTFDEQAVVMVTDDVQFACFGAPSQGVDLRLRGGSPDDRRTENSGREWVGARHQSGAQFVSEVEAGRAQGGLGDARRVSAFGSRRLDSRLRAPNEWVSVVTRWEEDMAKGQMRSNKEKKKPKANKPKGAKPAASPFASNAPKGNPGQGGWPKK